MKKLLLLSAFLSTNLMALTDLDIVRNYKAETELQKKCKWHLYDALDADDRINLVRGSVGSEYEYNDALNEYVEAAFGVTKTCKDTSNQDIQSLSNSIRTMAVLRQRMLMGLE